MDYLPIFLSIRGKRCLVVGAGKVAAGKVALLAGCGASVRVVSPALGPELAGALSEGRFTWRQGLFEASDLSGAEIVIAATEDEATNAEVVRLAERGGALANAVSGPRRGQFIVPAIIDRAPLIAAIGTGGTSPALARYVRSRLERLIPASFGRLAVLAREFRDEARERIRSPERRRAFWDSVFEGSIAELVFAGRAARARELLRAVLGQEAAEEVEGGRGLGSVALVGAGPGDPELLTLRAMRLIRQGDVVVYDRLVSAPVLELVRRDAERIYAGKRRGRHHIPQPDINRLLVDLARRGKRVVRLKGGDPFVFGRGGEEIALLAEEGIPFQVVPGITAANGCAAYAGIPLTHRDHAQACIFVTGHRKDGTVALDWEMLARPRQTVVVYMGTASLAVICAELAAHGLAEGTPAALLERGTLQGQRVLTGTLATLPAIVSGEQVAPPSLLIVGEVVRLRERLAWFSGSMG